jgi:hypothetical protein
LHAEIFLSEFIERCDQTGIIFHRHAQSDVGHFLAVKGLRENVELQQPPPVDQRAF